MQGYMDNFSIGDQAEFNECKESDLYKLDALDDADIDIKKNLAPTNKRFTLVAYSDASFAVGETKQSVVFHCIHKWHSTVVGFVEADCGSGLNMFGGICRIKYMLQAGPTSGEHATISTIHLSEAIHGLH